MNMKVTLLHGNAMVAWTKDADAKLNELTIMRPSFFEDVAGYHPAESITLYGVAAKQLYEFLHETLDE
ncbi:MAG: hypothetical protein K6T30_09510 [Alicyclobacillus sp.]|nr:hypothetical protein [Alicyclobacillus sp.]